MAKTAKTRCSNSKISVIISATLTELCSKCIYGKLHFTSSFLIRQKLKNERKPFDNFLVVLETNGDRRHISTQKWNCLPSALLTVENEKWKWEQNESERERAREENKEIKRHISIWHIVCLIRNYFMHTLFTFLMRTTSF